MDAAIFGGNGSRRKGTWASYIILFAFLIGSSLNCSSTGTNAGFEADTGRDEVGLEEVQLLSVRFSEITFSRILRSYLALGGVYNEFADHSFAKFGAFESGSCTVADFPETSCGGGTHRFNSGNCTLLRNSYLDPVLIEILGFESQLKSCFSEGVFLAGSLSYNLEAKLPASCFSEKIKSPCPDILLRLEKLTGSWEVTDETGTLWNLRLIDGTYEAKGTVWDSENYQFRDGQILMADLEVQSASGSRFRCLIDGEGATCFADGDGDGVPDSSDNCPEIANEDQQDVDGDGVGDQCDNANVPCKVAPTCSNTSDCDAFLSACPIIDSRLKNDGFDLFCLEGSCKVFIGDINNSACVGGPADPNDLGYCYDTCSTDQECVNRNGKGYSCFNGCCLDQDQIDFRLEDTDHDGVFNFEDNCYEKLNPTQGDCDKDGYGDACDNCPLDYNPSQEDSENPEFAGDGIGDVCDPDDDNDGIPDTEDPCPYNPLPATQDSDSDGVPDLCDVCPDVYDPDQLDQDNDRYGDACDVCPLIGNNVQNDLDGDGLGDDCDPDIDGDDVPNEEDNCYYFYNPDQLDSDGDGIGDVCDFGPPPPPPSCGDGFCDPKAGETDFNCPDDCGVVVPPSFCGDGFCDPKAGEDESTCPIDCNVQVPPSFCGDGVCDPKAGEDSSNCPDCAIQVPPSFCGDGFCDPKAGEDPSTCPIDCVATPPPVGK